MIRSAGLGAARRPGGAHPDDAAGRSGDGRATSADVRRGAHSRRRRAARDEHRAPRRSRWRRRLRWIHSTRGRRRPVCCRPPSSQSDIVVTNSRGVHSDAIAEHAIALVLALRRQLHTAVQRQRDRVWAQVELSTVPIPPLAGDDACWSSGSARSAPASPAWPPVSACASSASAGAPRWPPAGRDRGRAGRTAGRGAPRGRRRSCSPFRAPTTPGCSSARAEFAMMKPDGGARERRARPARGRGRALAALDVGQIAGAGLDAFHQEPLPPDHPLWALPNVLITPHTAAFTGDYWTPVVDLFLDNVERFRRGRAAPECGRQGRLGTEPTVMTDEIADAAANDRRAAVLRERAVSEADAHRPLPRRVDRAR